jgi:hypothetical protein
MIRAVRRSRLASSLALIGLAALLAVTISSPLHDGGDDAICHPVHGLGGQHDDQFAAAHAPASQPAHCVICHALGTIRAEAPSGRFEPCPVETRVLAPGAPTFVHSLFGTATAARAPPTA